MTDMPTPGYALDTTWRTLLRDLGIAPADVLRRAGLADDLFVQPSVRLAAADYYRLWSSLEAQLAGAPLAVRVCEAIRSESFSPPLFAALCSPNLRMAAQRLAKYKALIGPMRLDVVPAAGTLTLTFAWLDAPISPSTSPPASLVMMELLFCVQLARIGTREPVRPMAVLTPEPPPHAAPYEDFLGVRVQRGPAHQVVFAAADAQQPFLTSNEPLWAAFEPGLRQRLADLQAPVTTAARVRAALLEGLPGGTATVEAVSGKLALSKRTLQRRIEAEGTSFARLLQETREALARHYLEETALPATEIAFLLGFDEPNSFYRAFRSWTGTTPDSLRHGTAS